MKKTIVAATALGLLMAASPLEAQDRWGVELRANGAVSTRDVGADGRDYAGFGFEGTVSYRFMPHLSAYAGWDWMRFSPEDAFAGFETDFEETGYVFGLRFEHPLRGDEGSWPSAWVRAGGTYDHVEIEDDGGSVTSDSGHGLGWEVGGGLSMAFVRGWRLTPGVRYRTLSRDIEVGSTEIELNLDYVVFEVGFARHF